MIWLWSGNLGDEKRERKNHDYCVSLVEHYEASVDGRTSVCACVLRGGVE